MARIPCGYSLPNYYTCVNEHLRPLQAGMPGELCLGGAGVSRGYLNSKKLINQHSIPNPFAMTDDVANSWTRMYLTGDIGHLNEAGAICSFTTVLQVTPKSRSEGYESSSVTSKAKWFQLQVVRYEKLLSRCVKVTLNSL